MPTAVTERLDSPRILAGTRGELRLTVYQDGVAVDIANAPSPTVTLTNADTGAAIAPATALAEEATGKLVQVLTGTETATPMRIKAAWTATVPAVAGVAMTFTTYHEIVGDVLFSLSEARAFDDGALSNTTRYPDADVLAMRDRIAEAFEDITRRAFGSRATRETLDGDGSTVAWLAAMDALSVTAAATRERVSSTWTALTASELATLALSPNGRLEREDGGVWPLGARNVRVDLLYGLERVPLEVKRAGLWVLRQHLAGSNIPRNAVSQIDELGTFQLSIPGRRENTWFGFPEVDEALARYRRRVPAVG